METTYPELNGGQNMQMCRLFQVTFTCLRCSDKSYSMQVLSKSSMWEHLFIRPSGFGLMYQPGNTRDGNLAKFKNKQHDLKLLKFSANLGSYFIQWVLAYCQVIGFPERTQDDTVRQPHGYPVAFHIY